MVNGGIYFFWVRQGHAALSFNDCDGSKFENSKFITLSIQRVRQNHERGKKTSGEECLRPEERPRFRPRERSGTSISPRGIDSFCGGGAHWVTGKGDVCGSGNSVMQNHEEMRESCENRHLKNTKHSPALEGGQSSSRGEGGFQGGLKNPKL